MNEISVLIVSAALVIITIIICKVVIVISLIKIISRERQHNNQMKEAERIKKEAYCKQWHQKNKVLHIVKIEHHCSDNNDIALNIKRGRCD